MKLQNFKKQSLTMSKTFMSLAVAGLISFIFMSSSNAQDYNAFGQPRYDFYGNYNPRSYDPIKRYNYNPKSYNPERYYHNGLPTNDPYKNLKRFKIK